MSISAIGSGGCPPFTAKTMGVSGVGGAGGGSEGSGGDGGDIEQMRCGIRMTLVRSTILLESLFCLSVGGVRSTRGGVRKMGGVLPCLLSGDLVAARCVLLSGVCIFVVSVSCK